MDSDRTNRWLTLAANVGVVIGLILVAYEVRQTNVALDRDYDIFWTDVNGRLREGWREFNGRIINSEEVANIWLRGNAGEELSAIEAERYRYLANDIVFLYQQQFEQWQRLDRDTGQMVDRVERSMTGRPGLRNHLRNMLRENPESDFARMLLDSDLPFLDESTGQRDN